MTMVNVTSITHPNSIMSRAYWTRIWLRLLTRAVVNSPVILMLLIRAATQSFVALDSTCVILLLVSVLCLCCLRLLAGVGPDTFTVLPGTASSCWLNQSSFYSWLIELRADLRAPTTLLYSCSFSKARCLGACCIAWCIWWWMLRNVHR